MKQILTLMITLCLLVVFNFSYGQSDYIMMEKGKVFKYKYGDVYNAGQIDEKMIVKIAVLNTMETINGKEYFKVQTSTGSDGNYVVGMTTYFRTAADGSVYTILEDDTDNESLMLRSSMKVGDTWEDKTYSGEPSYKKVLELDGRIKTPAGTFANCLVLETKEKGTQTRSYLKKGVGMVATTVVMDGTEKVFIYMLED